MRFVILPQAIEKILPAIANEFVTIIKEHCGTACGGRLCLLLPDVPHQQDHRLLRKENEPWRPEIS